MSYKATKKKKRIAKAILEAEGNMICPMCLEETLVQHPNHGACTDCGAIIEEEDFREFQSIVVLLRSTGVVKRKVEKQEEVRV